MEDSCHLYLAPYLVTIANNMEVQGQSPAFLCYFVLFIFKLACIRERPLDFQGGAWVFQSGQNIFFCHFQGQNIFFQTIMSQNIFFSSHTGPEYFFLYNTNKFGSNFSVEPQIGFKTIILRLSAVCLCVCPTAMTLSGIQLPIPNTLQYHFI